MSGVWYLHCYSGLKSYNSNKRGIWRQNSSGRARRTWRSYSKWAPQTQPNQILVQSRVKCLYSNSSCSVCSFWGTYATSPCRWQPVSPPPSFLLWATTQRAKYSTSWAPASWENFLVALPGPLRPDSISNWPNFLHRYCAACSNTWWTWMCSTSASNSSASFNFSFNTSYRPS